MKGADEALGWSLQVLSERLAEKAINLPPESNAEQSE